MAQPSECPPQRRLRHAAVKARRVRQKTCLTRDIVANGMASIEFLHFCEHAFWDSRGQPCLIGVIGSDVYAASFPLRIASLTIAIAVRVSAGDTARIRLELGPPSGDAERAWNLSVPGPPKGGQADAVAFLPFRTLALVFDRPLTVEARLIEDGQVLATKAMRIIMGDPPRRSPIGPSPPDPHQ